MPCVGSGVFFFSFSLWFTSFKSTGGDGVFSLAALMLGLVAQVVRALH